jgi:integrase/recombinase XerD
VLSARSATRRWPAVFAALIHLLNHWFRFWDSRGEGFVGVDAVGRVRLVASVPLLHPEQQMVEEMLAGWRNQQLSRNLQFATIDQRIRYVQRFIGHVNEHPWDWTPALVEEYFGDLRSVKRLSHSTLRGHQSALRHFTDYICNPDYGWDRACEQLFGTHPSQVFFDWNTASHVQEYEGRPVKRPFTREELQWLFDHADDEVERVAASGRKGWQAAYRDAVMLKVAYSYGLRCNELRHLQTVDFARNPHAREFGRFGVCKVRYGKSRRCSPNKPRSVLTVFGWTPAVIEDWLANGRGDPGTLDLFTSERGGLATEATLLRRLRRYCAELELPEGLDLHSIRRSYATHLLEDGYDPMFVQHQMGHEHPSTTGIYQFVSDDFRNKSLRAALNRTVGEALGASQ